MGTLFLGENAYFMPFFTMQLTRSGAINHEPAFCGENAVIITFVDCAYLGLNGSKNIKYR